MAFSKPLGRTGDGTAVLVVSEPSILPGLLIQWEFQDPKMEVLYHIRRYFVGIFPYIALT
jgi:hypothetical protein